MTLGDEHDIISDIVSRIENKFISNICPAPKGKIYFKTDIIKLYTLEEIRVNQNSKCDFNIYEDTVKTDIKFELCILLQMLTTPIIFEDLIFSYQSLTIINDTPSYDFLELTYKEMINAPVEHPNETWRKTLRIKK